MRLRKPKHKGTAWRLEGHRFCDPHDTGTCQRATSRRQLRSKARNDQPGPNPTHGPSRAFRRNWQLATAELADRSLLLRIRHGKLEHKRP